MRPGDIQKTDSEYIQKGMQHLRAYGAIDEMAARNRPKTAPSNRLSGGNPLPVG